MNVHVRGRCLLRHLSSLSALGFTSCRLSAESEPSQKSPQSLCIQLSFQKSPSRSLLKHSTLIQVRRLTARCHFDVHAHTHTTVSRAQTDVLTGSSSLRNVKFFAFVCAKAKFDQFSHRSYLISCRFFCSFLCACMSL